MISPFVPRHSSLPCGVPRSKAGFTLPELLTVVTIIALLMMASFGALTRARVLAKRTKAEAQLRELINAYEQYYATYGDWPSFIQAGRAVDVDSKILRPLTDPNYTSENPRGIVFLNINHTDEFLDPWKGKYKLMFETGTSGGDRNKTAFEATVALPRRFTMAP